MPLGVLPGLILFPSPPPLLYLSHVGAHSSGMNTLSRELLPAEEADPGSLINFQCLELFRRGLQARELRKAWGPSWVYSSGQAEMERLSPVCRVSLGWDTRGWHRPEGLQELGASVLGALREQRLQLGLETWVESPRGLGTRWASAAEVVCSGSHVG